MEWVRSVFGDPEFWGLHEANGGMRTKLSEVTEFAWVTDIAMGGLLVVCCLLVVRLCKKYDIPWHVRGIFLPHMHESVVKKWLEKESSNVAVRAKFTDGAVDFIKTKYSKEVSLEIILSSRYMGGAGRGRFSLPCVEIRLGATDESEDFVKVESNAGILVLVAREIYEVLKQERIPLIVTTSGFWKFKKLEVAQDFSWLLYRKRRWPISIS